MQSYVFFIHLQWKHTLQAVVTAFLRCLRCAPAGHYFQQLTNKKLPVTLNIRTALYLDNAYSKRDQTNLDQTKTSQHQNTKAHTNNRT